MKTQIIEELNLEIRVPDFDVENADERLIALRQINEYETMGVFRFDVDGVSHYCYVFDSDNPIAPYRDIVEAEIKIDRGKILCNGIDFNNEQIYHPWHIKKFSLSKLAAELVNSGICPLCDARLVKVKRSFDNVFYRTTKAWHEQMACPECHIVYSDRHGITA